ncbi:SulP family inorganic anion transporter [Noviherbaspirillum cavernae]|uniref:SulP family inorganic anion transporter n=1 Tax=Noviherbaspirillum cavernae TaxID=2320862 RepID=UPI001F5B1AD0|nr:SulP family inorganic anion transporter [Noviherbaspirillum cavernae]
MPSPPAKGLPIKLARFFPFLRWPRPTLSSLQRDAWAGITVGLVLIPQAIAYATLAGMPPQTGLYAALLPSVIGILWGSSPLLGVGPVALTSLLVFGSLSSLAAPTSAQWVALAIWLSLYAGAIQFLLGAFRLGQIASLVSQPVITGFVNAAALLIIASQVPALLGLPELAGGDVAAAIGHAKAQPAAMAITAAFGAAALVLLLVLKRIAPKFPGILFVTVLGIGASWAFDYAGHGGAIVGTIVAGVPPLLLPPAIPFDSHRELWPAALILALVSFTEAMSSCRTIARRRHERWDENQELMGQGMAKITSGLVGAFPVSGSFSRSALNLYAGAASAWSTLFAALCVLASLLFLTDVIQFLPRSVLAAMIVVPVFGLLDFSSLRRLLSVSKDDGAIALVTFAVTLLSVPRLHWGVFAGVGLTMVSFLYRRSHPRIIEVARHEDGTLRDRSRFDLPPLAPDVLAVRMDSALNFLTAAGLERFILDRTRANRGIRRVLFCAGSVNDIDASGVDTLEALRETLFGEGVELYLSAVKKQVWDVLDRAGVITDLGSDHVFATDREAMLAVAAAEAV